MSVPNLPPIIASRYLPIRLIAKGGMGAVYEVEHARTGEHLALKVLLSNVGASTEDIERFKRETRASARIKSEHVVRVTDADVAPELDGAPFLVMELLEGADLEREAASTPPSPATVVDWLRQVARALDKAHRLGIVHRDLKPENLFLARADDRAPIVKILDFGIVKMAAEGGGATGSGQILGTPRYMAPEQAATRNQVTSAADRYALGLVAYRLITGESYYQGDVMSILAQLLHDPLQPPSLRHLGFGSAFDAWFLKACHRDPEARFTSASEQIQELSAAFALPTIAVQAPRGPVREVTSPRSRRVVVAAVLVVAGVATVSLLAMLLRRPPSASRAGATPAASVSSASPISPASEPPPASSPATTFQAPPLAAPVAGSEPAPDMPPRRRGKLREPKRPAPDSPGVAQPAAASEKPPATDPYADQK
jgi:eukaryotic-like serine/threonine-protein kinase